MAILLSGQYISSSLCGITLHLSWMVFTPRDSIKSLTSFSPREVLTIAYPFKSNFEAVFIRDDDVVLGGVDVVEKKSLKNRIVLLAEVFHYLYVHYRVEVVRFDRGGVRVDLAEENGDDARGEGVDDRVEIENLLRV